MRSGETKIFRYQVLTPRTPYEMDRTYGVTSAAFINCHNTGLDTGVTSAPYTQIVLTEYYTWYEELLGVPWFDKKEETCFDNQMNQDETDIDCGGDTCMPCDVGKMCKRNSDCFSHLACLEGRCRMKDDMSQTEKISNTMKEFSITIGEWALLFGVLGLAILGLWFFGRRLLRGGF